MFVVRMSTILNPAWRHVKVTPVCSRVSTRVSCFRRLFERLSSSPPPRCNRAHHGWRTYLAWTRTLFFEWINAVYTDASTISLTLTKGDFTHLLQYKRCADRHRWSHRRASQQLPNLKTENDIVWNATWRLAIRETQLSWEGRYCSPISPCFAIGLAWILRISKRACSFGKGISAGTEHYMSMQPKISIIMYYRINKTLFSPIFRSSLPGRRRAGSSVSGLFVAMISLTWPNASKPSIWLSSYNRKQPHNNGKFNKQKLMTRLNIVHLHQRSLDFSISWCSFWESSST